MLLVWKLGWSGGRWPAHGPWSFAKERKELWCLCDQHLAVASDDAVVDVALPRDLDQAPVPLEHQGRGTRTKKS